MCMYLFVQKVLSLSYETVESFYLDKKNVAARRIFTCFCEAMKINNVTTDVNGGKVYLGNSCLSCFLYKQIFFVAFSSSMFVCLFVVFFWCHLGTVDLVGSKYFFKWPIELIFLFLSFQPI